MLRRPCDRAAAEDADRTAPGHGLRPGGGAGLMLEKYIL
ncbi:hypothetical protein CSB93_1168 [Pseudomonas paraeruginosa]|uniref:Uncharacterized protein n=1 Tax=Pseudomonas paraeruginosa TaxID=2994495 RepID=A0A2R3IXW2_9PSED|nr:hypothetical protein CSB93_1168 [Pseudomonas paraeruginosa]AWE89582.1 hypothetical protein CSC28_6484 [Pseudomonas paraeruginosa]PTC33456.1 hypothetical protein CLJ1_6124 [Pseudomonas aeruginosa]